MSVTTYNSRYGLQVPDVKKKKIFWCLISNQYHKFPKKHNYLLNSNMITWQYFCMINSNQSKSLDVCYSARSQFQTQNSNLMKYHTMENNTDKMVSWQLPPPSQLPLMIIAPEENCSPNNCPWGKLPQGKLLPRQFPPGWLPFGQVPPGQMPPG